MQTRLFYCCHLNNGALPQQYGRHMFHCKLSVHPTYEGLGIWQILPYDFLDYCLVIIVRMCTDVST